MNKLKNPFKLIFISVLILFPSWILAQKSCYYQLKVYSIDNESQEQRMDSYLKNALIPALHTSGIKTVGVFKPNSSEPDAGKKIYILIPFKTLDEIETTGDNLLKDPKYLTDGGDYINANFDNPPYNRMEVLILKAFKEMPFPSDPKLGSPRSERIYELRSYQSATEKIFQNKVEMFNEGGEVKLFSKLDFNAVFYAEVISGPVMPNLMYMISFDNEKSQKDHWNTFGSHPEWNAMKDNKKYQNNVSHIDRYLLHPTEYSDL